MKIHKITTIICSIISFFTLAFAILFFIIADNVANTNCADTFTFVSNTMLGVFGSSLVLLISSIVLYHIEKKNTISVILFYFEKFTYVFLDIWSLIMKEENDVIVSDYNYAKEQLLTDKKINELVKKDLEMYSEFKYSYREYLPFFKNSAKNKKVFEFLGIFSKMDDVVQVFDDVYVSNQFPFKNDSIIDISMLNEYLSVFLDAQNENTLKRAFDLLAEIEKYRSFEIHNDIDKKVVIIDYSNSERK